jgi:hypothetical protein
MPTLGFQLAANHRRQILHTTMSHHGSFNDKVHTCTNIFFITLFLVSFLTFFFWFLFLFLSTRFDRDVVDLHNGDRLRYAKFELFDKDGNNTEYNCPYYICDGGYLWFIFSLDYVHRFFLGFPDHRQIFILTGTITGNVS